MPIVIAPVGRPLKVIRILSNEKIKKHLADLGITVDCMLEVLSSSGGSVICRIKEGRLALDSSLATKIIVA